MLAFDADEDIAFCIGSDLLDGAPKRCTAVLTLAERAENNEVGLHPLGDIEDRLFGRTRFYDFGSDRNVTFICDRLGGAERVERGALFVAASRRRAVA